MTIYNWEDVKLEPMNPLLRRQAIHTANMTVALIHLDNGCVVPEHRHANEQVTVLLQGRLRFLSEGNEYTIAAGQVLQIPPDAPHSVEALEDSLAMDLFSPAREDWRSGDDAYLRGSK
jgi:quercetin dioxygenase-like cupin family protein